MKKYSLFFALLFSASFTLTAQSIIEIASYNFEAPDTCLFRETSGQSTSLSFQTSEMDCPCGVEGDGIFFDGQDEVILAGGVKDLFRKQDFTVSFYFKVTDPDFPGRMVLLTNKEDTCDFENLFKITYVPSNKRLDVFMIDDENNESSLGANVPETTCWNHVVVTRGNTTARLYINGERVASRNATGQERVDLENDGAALRVGHSLCSSDWHFEGFMDELRFHQGAMTAEQVEVLYDAPEKIGNGKFSLGTKDTTIFLGGSVDAFITSKCPSVSVEWTPNDGSINDPMIPSPVLIPTQDVLYAATFSDQYCTSSDSLFIRVIDPNDLDCTELFIPKAFTPNADGLNDVFGISNAVVMTDFTSFEIYDRWGNLVFEAIDRNDKWDGTYRGQPVNGNVFLYKVLYLCKDEEISQTGSVTIMR